jgi:type VI secretion system secreted protein VgrG
LKVGQSNEQKTGLKYAHEAGQEIHLKAGMNVVIEAGVQLTLKGPGGFVDINPSGVTIQGIMVLINSGGAAGTGSGSSPDSPEAPAAPDVADDGNNFDKM